VHASECSGCPLISLNYGDQLKAKEKMILDAFVGAGFAEATIKKIMKPCRPSPKTLGYRNKAKWILQKNRAGLHMGIYKAGTHEVVDIPRCAVHAPLINEISLDIKSFLVEEKVAINSGDLSKPSLRYLIVRYSFRDKKILCVFVTTKKNVLGLENVITRLEALHGDKIVAVVQNINDDEGNVLLGEANRFFKKKGELTEQMGHLRVSVGPLSFLQVNSSQASYLYLRVRELLGKGPYKQGLDLYGGVGLMAMHLASSTDKILSVEEVGPAALEGVTAARRNKINNVLQLCADSYDGILTFQNEWGRPDWVVLNPPRKGCEAKVLNVLMQKPPKKLIYVSCGPKSLARDLRMLIDTGHYRLAALEPVDMFPQTAHVECIALLEQKKKVATDETSTHAAAGSRRGKRRARQSKGSKTLH
jgi:23S rRNA (uracil1939-C5)-methyltransferase